MGEDVGWPCIARVPSAYPVGERGPHMSAAERRTRAQPVNQRNGAVRPGPQGQEDTT